MLKKVTASIAATFVMAISAVAAEVPIMGNVTSKCTIHTDTPGVYGNPTPNKLSTDMADGGIPPIIRYDVISAGYYKAVITTPSSFTSGPTLSDTVRWTGSVEVSTVTDAGMSAYDTNKRIYNETTEFDLTVAGSTWFKATSKAEYGYNSAFPGGTYRAVIVAECIAL